MDFNASGIATYDNYLEVVEKGYIYEFLPLCYLVIPIAIGTL